jgi:filamentous hemagglutinin
MSSGPSAPYSFRERTALRWPNAAKAAAIAGDVSKATTITGDVGKAAAITGDAGKAVAVTGDAGKGAGVTGDAAKAAVEQFPDGLAYRKDLPAHLAGPDGFAPTGQLRGTHNLDNATKALDAKGATYSLEPTDTPGISELKYKYKDPVTGKTVSGRKTVYDPKVISDQTMLDDALKAGEQGWGKYLQDPTHKVFDVSEGGVNFRVYINTDSHGNAYVGNVHPIK